MWIATAEFQGGPVGWGWRRVSENGIRVVWHLGVEVAEEGFVRRRVAETRRFRLWIMWVAAVEFQRRPAGWGWRRVSVNGIRVVWLGRVRR